MESARIKLNITLLINAICCKKMDVFRKRLLHIYLQVPHLVLNKVKIKK